MRVVPGGGSLRSTADGSGLFVTDLDDELHLVDTTSYDTFAGDEAFDGPAGRARPHCLCPTTTGWRSRRRMATSGTSELLVSGTGSSWQVTSDRSARHIAAGFERESANADHFESTVVVWEAAPPGRRASSWRWTARPSMEGSTTSSWTGDGDRLYVAGRDAAAWLRAYDTKTGGLLDSVTTTQTETALSPGSRPLQVGDRAPSLLRISNDGRTLATNDGADVVLVEPRTMRIATRLRGHTHRVIAADFSSDARLVAASALDGSTLVWDTGDRGDRRAAGRDPAAGHVASPSRRTPRRCTDRPRTACWCGTWPGSGASCRASTNRSAGWATWSWPHPTAGRRRTSGSPSRPWAGARASTSSRCTAGTQPWRPASATGAPTHRRATNWPRSWTTGYRCGIPDRPAPAGDDGAGHRQRRDGDVHSGRVLDRRRGPGRHGPGRRRRHVGTRR